MHAGTMDDTYLKDPTNLEWVKKSNNWAQFLSVACIGTIHKSNPKIRQELAEYLPNAAGVSKG